MVKISVESFSEEELRKRFNALTKKGDWDKECEACKNPQILHKANCTRKVEVGVRRRSSFQNCGRYGVLLEQKWSR